METINLLVYRHISEKTQSLLDLDFDLVDKLQARFNTEEF